MSRNHRRKNSRKKVVYVIKSRPFYKNVWFYISVILFFSLGVSTSTKTNGNTKKIAKSSVVKENETSSKTEDSSKKNVESDQKEIEYREDVSTDDFELKIVDVGETEEIRESDFYSYKSDNGKYALINIYIKNTSNELVSIDSSSFKLIYGDKKYSPSRMIGLSNDYINFSTLNPDMDMSGNIVFEVPKDVSVQDCTLKLSLTDLFSEPIIFKLQ